MVGTHGKIYYSDLPQSAFVWQGNLVLALGSAYGEQISTAGSQVLAAKLRNIINALRRLFTGNEPEAAPITTDVPQILGRLQPQADLYVAPGIPRDKLMNAREKCAVPEGEHILGLIDCTLFGSAKDCVLFGEKAIYYHNVAGGEGKILYSYLPRLSFSVSGSSVLTSEGERINIVGSEINAQELQNILLIIQQLVSESSQ